uniref:Lon N-terminal domain-containing protein n=1 Tax=Ostreococcus mediterraneus TaxID=1486918 RepID=A0A7S1EP40_9CHLO
MLSCRVAHTATRAFFAARCRATSSSSTRILRGRGRRGMTRDVTRKNDESEFGYAADSSDEDERARDWYGDVVWLPKMDPRKDPEVEPTLRAELGEFVIPMFPLGSHVYLPDSEHVLNIFEPRYRSMYSDILFNGSRRFAVPMCAPQEEGVFASVAPVFYLDDLKEVSEQTNDQVKYVCSHSVIERVRIKRVLNDKMWGDRSSYLKCVAEKFEDTDLDEDLSGKETMLEERFAKIIELQEKLEEPVRFTSNLTATISAARGENGFWRLVGLWQSLLQNRVSAKENELSQNIQELLRSYLEKSGTDLNDGRKIQLEFATLPDNIKNEFNRLQVNYREECVELLNEAIYPFQYLVQYDSHAARLDYFGNEMVAVEEKRLAAKNVLRSMFAGGDSSDDKATP